MLAIEREDIDRLKEIFVTRQDCDIITTELEHKFFDNSTRLAVIEQQLKTITWILTAVGGGVIAVLVKIFFGSVGV